MILRDIDIEVLQATHQIITPFNPRTVIDGMSYGLSSCGYDVRMDDACMAPGHPPELFNKRPLFPGEFIMLSTIERFRMPDNLMAVVHDKSTWARRGLAVQNTVIEPGWEGYLTLEVTNHSRDIVTIEPGWPIAQIVFHQLAGPVKTPYAGKYQDQPMGPVAARLEHL